MRTVFIQNGQLVDHARAIQTDLVIEDGVIKQIGKIEPAAEWQVIDATGLIVMPAFVDLHVHLRDPGFTYKEDLQSGSKAAVAGGYTTLNLMANTNPVCSSLDIAKDVVKRAKQIALCDVYQCVSLTRDFAGNDLSHLDELADDREQQYVKFVSEDGFGVSRGDVFYHGLQKCQALQRTIMVHAEDHDFSAIDMAFAEDLETIRDIYLAKKTGIPLHFCHVSTQVSAAAIIKAKKAGYPITFEVAPHHLALTDETHFRVNPPLRSAADRAFLLDCIQNDLVDAIATDHAPHTASDKEKGAPGLVGLETGFSVCYTNLVKSGLISLSQLSKLMSKAPADLMNIAKGTIAVGEIADLVLIDVEQERTIEPKNFYSKGKNTPFSGQKFYGEIIKTIKAGKVVFERADKS